MRFPQNNEKRTVCREGSIDASHDKAEILWVLAD